MKKTVWGVIIVVVLILLIWGINRNQKLASNEPIKIGFVGSLTGGLQSWGQEAKNSIEMAVNEVNDAGGVNGKLIDVIYEDGKCESGATASAVQKLINIDKVKIIIPFCSLEAMTAASITEKDKILLFASAATTPDLTNAGDYVFRLAPSDRLPAVMMADLLEKSYKNIAFITEISDFSSAFRKYTLDEISKNKSISVVYDESFNPGTNDFRSMISKIKSSKPDAVVVNANTATGEGVILKQMKELGLNIPVFGMYFGSDPEFIKVAGKSAEGFKYFNFVANKADPRVISFLDNYKKLYKEDSPNPQFATLSYDSIFILKNAIASVEYDSSKVKNYLYSMPSYNGLSGNVTFDKNGDSQGVNFSLFEVKNGQSVLIK